MQHIKQQLAHAAERLAQNEERVRLEREVQRLTDRCTMLVDVIRVADTLLETREDDDADAWRLRVDRDVLDRGTCNACGRALDRYGMCTAPLSVAD